MRSDHDDRLQVQFVLGREQAVIDSKRGPLLDLHLRSTTPTIRPPCLRSAEEASPKGALRLFGFDPRTDRHKVGTPTDLPHG